MEDKIKIINKGLTNKQTKSFGEKGYDPKKKLF